MSKRKKIGIVIVSLAVVLVPAVAYFAFPSITLRLSIKLERDAAGLEQCAIDVEGLHIEYLQGGHGETLLLLHGFGGDKDNWTRIGKYLTPHFRVLAPDLPGFGESTRDPDLNYGILAQVERIKAFVHALNLDAFHLAGQSMGGDIAGSYAAIHPKDVVSLWLIAPGGIGSSQPSEIDQEISGGQPDPFIVDDAEGYERLLDLLFVKRPFIPPPIKRHLIRAAIAHRALDEVISRQLQSRGNLPPLEALLSGSQIRTLIVWGDQDRSVHVSGAKILESVMPNAQAVIIENVGHVPMIEKPEQTADALLRFLGK